MVDQPAAPGHLLDVLGEVGADRVALDESWAHHDRPDGMWALMLSGQVAEALDEPDPEVRRAKLVRVGALAVAWVQALDRRPATEVPAAPTVLAEYAAAR